MTTRHIVRRAAAAGVAAVAIASGPLLASASFAGTHAKLTAAIRAHPERVLANGTATTHITVKLFHGHIARHAAVALTTADTPSGGGSCGTLTATSGTTGRNGMFRTTYTSSLVVGFCTVTVTSGAATASTTIDQIDPVLAAASTRYSISATVKPRHLKADGKSATTATITVTNGSLPVAGDAIFVGERSLRANACGTIALSSPTTDALGQVTVTYTASTTAGGCFLRAQEAQTGAATGGVVIHQH